MQAFLGNANAPSIGGLMNARTQYIIWHNASKNKSLSRKFSFIQVRPEHAPSTLSSRKSGTGHANFTAPVLNRLAPTLIML
jgi:hypothetical protein